MQNLPIKKATLEEICEYRRQAIECYRLAFQVFEKGNKFAKKACQTNAYAGRSTRDFQYGFDAAKAEIDRQVWRHLMQATSIGDFMDATARKEFERSLELANPPEATFDNAAATLTALAGSAPHMVERGIVELFQNLDKRYRVNHSFKVNKRLKLTYVLTQMDQWGSQHFHHYGRHENHLQDLERTLHVVDGTTPPDHSNNIVSKMGAHLWGKTREMNVETEYMRVRWFKNGNIDVEIKKPELIKRINRIIAKHFGETVADEAA